MMLYAILKCRKCLAWFLGLLCLLIIGVVLYTHHAARDSGTLTRTLSGPSAPVLPKNDKEQLRIDPRRHTITVVTRKHTTTTTLPDTPTIVDVFKDGNVKVIAPPFGFEWRPFIGMGYSDDARLALGIDSLFFKRLDLGAGIQMNFHMTEPRAFIGLSYNLKDNLRVTLTIDHKEAVGGFLTLRI